MSVGVDDLSRWRAAPLDVGVDSGLHARARFGAATEALARSAPSPFRWDGDAAAAASETHTELTARVAGVAVLWADLVRALSAAEGSVAAVERLVAHAQFLAHATGLEVTPSGHVVDPTGCSPARTEVEASLQTARGLAARADEDLSLALARLIGSSDALCVGTGRRPSTASVEASWRTSLAPGPDPAAWWATLTPDQRLEAMSTRPDLVGSADGLPGWARDQANRILLDRDEEVLNAQERALRPPADGAVEGLAGAAMVGTLGGGSRRVAYAQVLGKLAAIRAARTVLATRDGQVRQLLVLDLSGRDAKVAVSVGNLDRADHVAVLVDGFTTTPGQDLVGADSAAAHLNSLARRQAMGWGDRGEVATVTWMGYDAPQLADTLTSTHSLALRTSAEAGAGPLAAFVAGVSAGRQVTLVGHSYGSTTAALAVARGGTRVDDLVVMGSPGLGVPIQRLGLPPSRVHVVEADTDPVADLGWFGQDPDRIPGVDVVSASSSVLPDGSVGMRSSGHSEYLTPGTTSQWNVAAVIAGTTTVVHQRN